METDAEAFDACIFGPRMGSWSVHSDTDPRWNKEGRDYGLVCNGGPRVMRDWVDHCKKTLGEIPEDCTSSFYKD